MFSWASTNAKAPVFPGLTTVSMTIRVSRITSRGVEQGAETPGNTANSQPRGAQNGALAAQGQWDGETSAQGSVHGEAQIDVGLVVVIQAWPHLLEAIRKGILALVCATA